MAFSWNKTEAFLTMDVNSNELMKNYTLSTASSYYIVIAHLLAERPLANSILILALLLPASVIIRQSNFSRHPGGHTNYDRQTNSRPNGVIKEKYSLWMSLLLLLSPAFEFPFMFALHPVILASYSQPASPPKSNLMPNTVPSPIQLALQVAGYFVVQSLFSHYVLRFVTIPLATEQPETDKSKADDELLTAMVMDFVRPRGTLLLGMAAMGLPSVLNRVFGRLHPLAMVTWIVVDWIGVMLRGRVRP